MHEYSLFSAETDESTKSCAFLTQELDPRIEQLGRSREEASGNARARFESVKTRVGVARGTRTNAPFTSNPRRCPPSPFPPPRRSAPSRYVARSRSRRAREPGPPRREKRRRLRCRVFVARASRRTGRADGTAGSRANAVARCFRGRRIERTRDRPRRRGSPGSTSTDTHRRSASRVPDSTLTLLSGFERSTPF